MYSTPHSKINRNGSLTSFPLGVYVPSLGGTAKIWGRTLVRGGHFNESTVPWKRLLGVPCKTARRLYVNCQRPRDLTALARPLCGEEMYPEALCQGRPALWGGWISYFPDFSGNFGKS